MTINHKQNLSKKEIASYIKSDFGFSSKTIEKIVDDILYSITKILIENKKVNIKNFGAFYVTHKNKREGRNPKTKEMFTISSREVIKFKPSNLLKQKIND